MILCRANRRPELPLRKRVVITWLARKSPPYVDERSLRPAYRNSAVTAEPLLSGTVPSFTLTSCVTRYRRVCATTTCWRRFVSGGHKFCCRLAARTRRRRRRPTGRGRCGNPSQSIRLCFCFAARPRGVSAGCSLAATEPARAAEANESSHLRSAGVRTEEAKWRHQIWIKPNGHVVQKIQKGRLQRFAHVNG